MKTHCIFPDFQTSTLPHHQVKINVRLRLICIFPHFHTSTLPHFHTSQLPHLQTSTLLYLATSTLPSEVKTYLHNSRFPNFPTSTLSTKLRYKVKIHLHISYSDPVFTVRWFDAICFRAYQRRARSFGELTHCLRGSILGQHFHFRFAPRRSCFRIKKKKKKSSLNAYKITWRKNMQVYQTKPCS